MYTDLELNKMIAELEGDNPGDYEWCYDNYFYGELYKPAKGPCKLEDLMFKYKVNIDFENMILMIHDDTKDCTCITVSCKFKSESEIPRAIIECILKSENII